MCAVNRPDDKDPWGDRISLLVIRWFEWVTGLRMFEGTRAVALAQSLG